MLKIAIVTPKPAHAEAWARAVAGAANGGHVNVIERPLHEVTVVANGSRPDLVVAESVSAGDFDALESLANSHPEVDFILIGAEMAPEALMRAMRAGVREVLPAAAAPESIAEAVERIARKRRAPLAVERNGELLGFVSCKGGSGATFAAANLAHVLAANGQRRVALIDLNLQFGDAALFVSNEKPRSHVADVAHNIHRLDRDLLQSAMLNVSNGLYVLAAPDDPAQATEVTPAHVQAILRQARSMFDFVVIDAGRSLSAVTLQALDSCQRVYAVLQLTLPFIRDGKRLRDVFRSLDYPADRLHWIVNRCEKNSQITLEDLKSTMGVQQLITLPNQYEVVAASVNQGVPVAVVAPNSAITRALRDLAVQIAPLPEKSRSGWLAGLLRGTAAARA